jgi:nicotinamidase/pyrazinamidase
MQTALLIVDVQNDFCPGGALGVRHGDRVVPVVNALAARFAELGRPVLASRDWHPRETLHFVSGGGPWPEHCVAGSSGAAFHPDLRLPPGTILLNKGEEPDAHGYSAYEGRTLTGEPLGAVLERAGVGRLVVVGLATDYCVRQTVLDARRQGLEVVVVSDAVLGVDVEAGDSARALEEMAAAGAAILPASALALEESPSGGYGATR